jgi:hypothetical protein
MGNPSHLQEYKLHCLATWARLDAGYRAAAAYDLEAEARARRRDAASGRSGVI